MKPARLLVVAACVLATSGYLRLLAATDVVPRSPQLATLPLTIGEWRGQDQGRLDRETESILRADDYVLRTYQRAGGLPVSLFVAYYATQRAGHTMHSPANCLPGTGWSWTARDRARLATAAGREIEVNRNVARKDGAQALVYYWYQSRGRVVASDYQNKLVLMRDALVLHRSDGAIARVITPIAPGDVRPAIEAEAFIRAAHSALSAQLPE